MAGNQPNMAGTITLTLDVNCKATLDLNFDMLVKQRLIEVLPCWQSNTWLKFWHVCKATFDLSFAMLAKQILGLSFATLAKQNLTWVFPYW